MKLTMAEHNTLETEATSTFLWTIKRYLCDSVEKKTDDVTQYCLKSAPFQIGGGEFPTTWAISLSAKSSNALFSQHGAHRRNPHPEIIQVTATLFLISAPFFPVKAKACMFLRMGLKPSSKERSDPAGMQFYEGDFESWSNGFETKLTSVASPFSLQDLHHEMLLRCKITLLRPLTPPTPLPASSTPTPVPQTPTPLLHTLYASRELADVILKTKDGEVKAHRLVLAASSAIFRAMFVAEAKSEGVALDMKAHDTALVEEALRFLYTGELRGSPAVACDLLSLANRFGLAALAEACLRRAHATIDVGNAVTVYRLAACSGDTDVTAAARRFIRENFAAVSETAAWREKKNDPQFFADIFA